MTGFISRTICRPQKEQGCIDRKYLCTFGAGNQKPAKCVGMELKGVFVSPQGIEKLKAYSKSRNMSIGQTIEHMIDRQLIVK